MKKLSITTLLAGLCTGSALATGFSGSTDPSAFAVANTGTLIGAAPTLGTATFSAIQLVLVGSNSISPAPTSQAPGCSGGVYSTFSSPCQLQVTLARPGVYSFNWSYVSADGDGPAGTSSASSSTARARRCPIWLAPSHKRAAPAFWPRRRSVGSSTAPTALAAVRRPRCPTLY